jgi:predicted MFS family arabinose efflux permease
MLLITYPLAGWLGAGAGLKVDFAVLGLIAGAAVLVAARLWPHADSQDAEDTRRAPDDVLWRRTGSR